MSDIDIIFQIILVSFGMVLLSFILNKILGLKQETAVEIREKTLNLQERMQTAQALKDNKMMLELQMEMKELMTVMLKKQLIPLSIRCVIFLIIFSILGVIYGQYEFWYWTYFLSSLTISLITYGLRKLYRKATGKEQKSLGLSNLMGTMSQGFNPSEEVVHYSEPTPSKPQESWKTKIDTAKEVDKEELTPQEETQASASWKDKLQK